MDNNFYYKYTGHERNARALLLEKGLVDSDRLARMSSDDVANLIEQNYAAFNLYSGN